MKIITILNKQFRSKADLEFLYEFIKDIKFFQDMKDLTYERYEKICRCLNIEVFSKGDTVFEYGSFGEEFYVIITGSVEVLVPNQAIENFHDLHTMYEDLKDWY
jgi:signal-transduction protein with cAMP-binding, CBS, and nucleotidyltransferase domain